MDALGLAAAVLAVLAVWLAFDNPEIDDTGRGDDYQCLAPWDTVLNHADNRPNGEEPPDAGDIERRCRHAGERRFDLALVAAGGTSGCAAITAVIAAARPLRRKQA